MKLAGVVLAAGGSKRFGDANKLLAPLNGRPLVSHAVDTLETSDVDCRAVVLGYEADKVAGVLNGFSGALITNREWARGMATSIHHAVRWARDTHNATHLLVMLGDMPFITASHISALMDKSATEPDHIVRAVHNGVAGNPVIVPAAAFDRLLYTTGDEGARALIAEGFCHVDVALDGAVRVDVDTPDMLAGLRPET